MNLDYFKLYSHEELIEAYKKWCDLSHLVSKKDFSIKSLELRNAAWEEYCDVRDSIRLELDPKLKKLIRSFWKKKSKNSLRKRDQYKKWLNAVH